MNLPGLNYPQFSTKAYPSSLNPYITSAMRIRGFDIAVPGKAPAVADFATAGA
jgi:hypothetical protein